MKEIVRQLCPPIFWNVLRHLKFKISRSNEKKRLSGSQDLDVYWDPEMAEILEQWGEGNAWSEIQLIMADRNGKALDIACGTGNVMAKLASYPGLETYGCDISDMLIGKALERGISRERLAVTDATAMSYPTDTFDWGYSIGSLEHFTEEGIQKFLSECHRVVRGGSFHMVPVSRSGRDEGWIKTFQSYHNNSTTWWEERCRDIYARVHVLDSSWSDQRSVGKWLICEKAN